MTDLLLARDRRRGRWFLQSEHDFGRVTGHNAVRRHMCTNYGASRNDAAFTDRNAWEKDASQTDPHTVSDDDGTHVIRIWREPRPSRLRIGRMAVGVHNDSAAGQVTIAPQRDALANSEVTVVADFGAVTNFQQRVVG